MMNRDLGVWKNAIFDDDHDDYCLAVSYAASIEASKIKTFDVLEHVVKGEVVEMQKVTCGGRSVTIFGTSDDDVITGTEGKDVIYAMGGDDVIYAMGGDDMVCGGSGDDQIWLDAGRDIAYAGDGADTIYAGSGDDFVNGEEGDDTIYGGAGKDRLYGKEGDDVIYGGCGLTGVKTFEPQRGTMLKNTKVERCNPLEDGDDTLVGGVGSDKLYGAGGNDILLGSEDQDELYGQAGDDRFACGDGPRDYADGGSGNDLFLMNRSDCATYERIDIELPEPSGFYLSKEPLGRDGAYTSNDERSFIVAGCIPMRSEGDALGGHTVEVKDKLIESDFVSCQEMYEDGVLRGLYISEVKNRKWKHFRFSCRDMKAGGKLGSDWTKSKKLFNYDKEGDLYSSRIPTDSLSIGMMEINNGLTGSCAIESLGLVHAKADAIYDQGKKDAHAKTQGVTERVPKASPLLLDVNTFICPPGMFLTGAAIGHIPHKKEKWSKPYYVLGECRRLHRYDE